MLFVLRVKPFGEAQNLSVALENRACKYRRSSAIYKSSSLFFLAIGEFTTLPERFMVVGYTWISVVTFRCSSEMPEYHSELLGRDEVVGHWPFPIRPSDKEKGPGIAAGFSCPRWRSAPWRAWLGASGRGLLAGLANFVISQLLFFFLSLGGISACPCLPNGTVEAQTARFKHPNSGLQMQIWGSSGEDRGKGDQRATTVGDRHGVHTNLSTICKPQTACMLCI